MAEKSYLNTNLDANPTAQTQAPLYYTDQQMAQMLKPPPDPLSQIAGPANMQSILPQLYAQQANQADQPQGYRRGGTVASLHVNADMPNFAHLAKGGLPNIPIPVVDDRTAIDALMKDKSILSRYNVDPQTVPPERKPAVPKPAPGQGEERDDEGFVPGHAKGGLIGPTEAQKHAGNYKKIHAHVWGIPIAIENPAGSVRSGKGADGKPWSVAMPHHYGYFKRTEGKDGDQVDVHVGPHIETDQVHVIDQVHPDTGKFDEHKVMMGFRQPHEAVHAYHSSFSDGKGHLRMGGMVSLHIDDFKKWLKNKQATKRPAGPGIHKPAKRTGILQRFASGGLANAISGGMLTNGLSGAIANTNPIVVPLTGAIQPPAPKSPVALAGPVIAGAGSQIIDGSATDTGQGGYTVNPNTRDNLLASLFPNGVQKLAAGGQVEPADDNYFGVVPMLKGMVQTAKIPGQVLYGERQPTDDDALNMAMMATGAGAGALRGTGAAVAPAMVMAAPEAVDMGRRGILKAMGTAAMAAPFVKGMAAKKFLTGGADAATLAARGAPLSRDELNVLHNSMTNNYGRYFEESGEDGSAAVGLRAEELNHAANSGPNYLRGYSEHGSGDMENMPKDAPIKHAPIGKPLTPEELEKLEEHLYFEENAVGHMTDDHVHSLNGAAQQGPDYLRAMIQKKVSAQPVTDTMYDEVNGYPDPDHIDDELIHPDEWERAPEEAHGGLIQNFAAGGQVEGAPGADVTEDEEGHPIGGGGGSGAPMDYGNAADLHANDLVDAYHVTSPDNIKGIMKTGLGSGNVGTLASDDRPFITTDPNEADAFKNSQLDDNDSKIMHLKIPADEFTKLDPVTDYNMSDAGTSYHIRPISKDKIAQWLHAVYDDIPDDILEKKPHGGLIQKFAAGGPVMPVIKRYPSFLPGNNYVPPMSHYRDALGNTEMSATRNALQNMVR